MPILLSPVVTPTGDTGAAIGVPLGRYRRRIAKETGNYLASLVESGATSFLRDNHYPIKSNLDQGDLFSGKWLLRPTATAPADRVRIVAELGYDPATGTLRPDSPWSVGPATDEPYELHGVIEPWDQMNDLINEALKRCMVVDHLVLPADPGATFFNLTPYAPWLLDARWVRGAAFVDATSVDDPADIDMSQPTFRGWVEQQGRTMVLRWQGWPYGHAYSSQQPVLVLRCIKRAYDHCRLSSDGTFGELSGLSEEIHEGPVAEDWAAAGALVEFWNTFGDVVAAGNRDEAETNQAKVAQTFTTLTQQYFLLPPYTLLNPVKSGWFVGAY
jgi:hypothetical protein